jgi:hypothetical protein
MFGTTSTVAAPETSRGGGGDGDGDGDGQSVRERLAGRGRWLLLAVLVGYTVVVLYPSFGSYRPHWQRVGVSDAPYAFDDLASLTTAWDCTRQGVDPLIRNTCDPPSYRPANYPTVWFKLSHLGIGSGWTVRLGIGIALIFFASIFFLTGPLPLLDGVVWSAIVVSPSVMLGVNRGNVDVFLFSMLVVAIAFVARSGRRTRIVGCVLIELAALLKLFPIFAAFAVLQWRNARNALATFTALGVWFALYAFDRRDELRTIRSVVPKLIDLSFGAGVLIDVFRRTFGANAFLISHRTAAMVVLVVAAGIASVALALFLARIRGDAVEESTRLPLFWGGAAVFVGTWATTENSFDYRLVFTLLAVPQLLEWSRQARPAVPFPRTALAGLVLMLWLSDTLQPISKTLLHPWLAAETHFRFDELIVLALVVYLAAALIVTRPPWLERPNDVRRLLRDAWDAASG